MDVFSFAREQITAFIEILKRTRLHPFLAITKSLISWPAKSATNLVFLPQIKFIKFVIE